jgi:dienelactone hydrolase
MGISAGGAVVNSLLQARPDAWRGAVFSFCTPAIDPATLRLKRILIDGGGNDRQFKDGLARVRKWQDEAAQCGLPVELVVHPGVGHAYRSPVWEGTKMRQMQRMLDE